MAGLVAIGANQREFKHRCDGEIYFYKTIINPHDRDPFSSH